jgi:hypothetical protein
MTVELTTYDPPRHLCSRTSTRGIDIDSQLAFDEVPEGTRIRWASQLTPHGVFRLLTPLLAPLALRQTQTIWEALKRELESGPRETGRGEDESFFE